MRAREMVKVAEHGCCGLGHVDMDMQGSGPQSQHTTGDTIPECEIPQGAAVSRPDCAELGFTETLVCSKCARLESKLSTAGADLVAECNSCCSDDHDNTALTKAASAELEICQ